jgi:hypothetical protein
LSPDLARFIAEAPPESGPEDLVISNIVFRFPEPLNSIFIQPNHALVIHPVRAASTRRWSRIWNAEAKLVEANKEALLNESRHMR